MVAESVAVNWQRRLNPEDFDLPPSYSSFDSLNSAQSPPSHKRMAALDERSAVLYNNTRYAAAAAGLDLSSLAALRSNLHPDMNLLHERSSSGPGSTGSNGSGSHHRKQREFIPDAKKDESYWDRRRRNNEAAKRSREKRRLNDMVLEQRVLELTKENHILRAQLTAIHDKYGVTGEGLISMEQVLSTLPSAEQVISLTRASPTTLRYNALSPSPAPNPVVHSSAGITNGTRQSVLVTLGRQTPSPAPSSASPFSPTANPLSKDQRYRDTSAEALSYSRNTATPEVTIEKTTSAGRSHNRLLPPSSSSRQPRTSAEAGSKTDVTAFFEYGCSSGDEEGSTAGSPGCHTADVGNGRLPHKLRHKSHLGDKDSAAAAVLLSLTDIKAENALYEGESEAELYRGSGSSDEKDSGISSVSEWSNNVNTPSYTNATTPPINSSYKNGPEQQQQSRTEVNSDTEAPAAKRARSMVSFGSGALALALGANEGDSDLLRSQVARLASEVETLKTFLRIQAQAGIPNNADD
nr:EOG090X08JU [Triops cancriformis]